MSGTTTMAKKRKPKAAPAEEPVPIVFEIPPTCPRYGCRSTRRVNKKEGGKPRRIRGTTRDGRPYNVIRNYYAECADCGQKYAISTAYLEPEAT